MKIASHVFTFACYVAMGFSSLSLDASTLLVVNKSSHSVTLFDEPTLRPLKEVQVGYHPHEVAVSSDGKTALVSNYGNFFCPGSSLSVLDIPNTQVIKTIQLPPKSRPHGIVFISEEEALVTAEGVQSLFKINTTTGEAELFSELPGEGAHLLVFDREKNQVFVTNIGSGDVLKVELFSRQISARVKIGQAAEGLVLSQDGEYLLATNRKDSILAVLKTEDLSLVKTLKTSNGPIRLALFHHGASAVFSNSVSGSLQTFDFASMSLISTFKTTNHFSLKRGKVLGGILGLLSVPVTIVVREDQKTAYVANSFAGNITLINLENGEILKSFEAGSEPDGMALSSING